MIVIQIEKVKLTFRKLQEKENQILRFKPGTHELQDDSFTAALPHLV